MDGESLNRYTSLVIINNVQLYGGILPMAPKAYLDDGMLDICLFEGERLRSFARHLWAIVTRQHERDPRMTYYQVKELTLRTARPLPVHADDEICGHTPVTVRVAPNALKVIVPRVVPTNLFLLDRGKTPLQQWIEYFMEKHHIQWPPMHQQSSSILTGPVASSVFH